GVRGRLLQVLEQRVGSVGIEQVGVEDQGDAAVALERTHVQVAAEFADVVDPDLVAVRLEHVQVGMGTTLGAVGIAEQLPGEGERGDPLPYAARTMKKEGGRGSFAQRGRQQLFGLRLLDQPFETDAYSVTTSPRIKADSSALAFVLGFVSQRRSSTRRRTISAISASGRERATSSIPSGTLSARVAHCLP